MMTCWVEGEGMEAEAFADVMMSEVEEVFAQEVQFIAGDLQKRAPKATGELRRSLSQAGVDRVGDHGLDAWVGSTPYWWETDTGTGPVSVPVGDGSAGSGLLYWVKIKKLAVVQVTSGKHKGLFARRQSGIESRSGAEGALGSVSIFGTREMARRSLRNLPGKGRYANLPHVRGDTGEHSADVEVRSEFLSVGKGSRRSLTVLDSKSVGSSRQAALLSALEAAELDIAWAVHEALALHGLAAQHWVREAELARHQQTIADRVAEVIGGEAWLK